MSRTWSHWRPRISGDMPFRVRGGRKCLREDRWPYNEPKWWRKIYKHRRRRQEWRRCQSKLKKGYDMDNMVYPMDKKPWEYYW